MTRQREAFVTLLSNYDKYEELLEVSTNSAGTAQKKYEAYQDSIEAWTKKLQAAWEDLANDANIQQFIKSIKQFATYLVEWLPKILKYSSRFLVGLNSYRVTGLGKTLSSFFGGIGLKPTAEAIKKKGKKQAWWDWASGKEYSERGADFILKNKESTDSKNGLIAQARRLITGLDRNVTATENNTRAINGETPSSAPSSINNNNGQNKPRWEKGNYHYENKYDANGNIIGKKRVLGPKPTGERPITPEEEAALKKAQKQATATLAVSGAVTGALTASTTSNVGGQSYAMSKGASWLSRSNSATAGALGALGGPIVQQIAMTAADLLNTYVVGPLLDRESISAQQNAATGKALLERTGNISEQTQELQELGKKTRWSSEDYAKAEENIEATLVQLYKHSDDKDEESRNILFRAEYTNYLKEILNETHLFGEINNLSLQELTDINRNTNAQNRAVAQAMAIANARISEEGVIASQATQRFEIDEELNSAYGDYQKTGHKIARAGAIATGLTVGGGVTAGVGLVGGSNPFSWIAGVIAGLITGITTGIGSYEEYKKLEDKKARKKASLTLDQQITDAENDLKEAINSGNSEMISSTQDLLSELRSINSEVKQLNKEADTASIQTAILEATDEQGNFLSQLNQTQLKQLGPDKIINYIAKAIEKDGGLLGGSAFIGSTGIVGSYAENLILQQLKENDLFNSVVSGGIYTLEEAMKLQTENANGIDYKNNRNIQENFRQALGVSTITESQLADFGKLTLADLLKGAEEIKTAFESIASTVSNIVSSSKSWAETQNEIIKSYPELINSLNNGSALIQELFSKMEAYSKLDIQAKFKDISSNTEYFEQLSNQIKDNFDNDIYQTLIDNGITSIDDLMSYYTNNQTDANAKILMDFVSEQMSSITLISDYQKQYIDNIVKYQNTLLDREIASLNTQKAALADITKQREYENKLVEARLKLENASKEKKRVWREGVGWTYESDQTAISTAQKELKEIQNQKQSSEIDLQIEMLQASKELLSSISSEEELEKQRDIYEAWIKEYGEVIPNSINGLKTALTDKSSPLVQTSKACNEILEFLTGEKTNVRDSALKNLNEAFDILNGDESVAGSKAQLDAAQKAFNEAYASGDNNKIRAAKEYYNQVANKYNENLLNYQQAYKNAEDYIAEDEYTRSFSTVDELRKSNADKSRHVRVGNANTGYTYYHFNQATQTWEADDNYTLASDIAENKAFSATAKDWQTADTFDNMKYQEYYIDEQGRMYILSQPSVVSTIDKWAKKRIGKGDFQFFDKNGKPVTISKEVWKEIDKDTSDDTVMSTLGNEGRLQVWGFNGTQTYIFHNGKIYQDPDQYLNLSSANVDLNQRKLGFLNTSSSNSGGDLDELENFRKLYIDYLQKQTQIPNLSLEDRREWQEKLEDFSSVGSVSEYALGITSTSTTSSALINELGTEAIVTPSGTITALPAHTGIVTADLTENLSNLGAVAPQLAQLADAAMWNSLLRDKRWASLAGAGAGQSYDQSFNIDNLQMEVHADDTFDVDRFVKSIKDRAALTKNK